MQLLKTGTGVELEVRWDCTFRRNCLRSWFAFWLGDVVCRPTHFASSYPRAVLTSTTSLLNFFLLFNQLSHSPLSSGCCCCKEDDLAAEVSRVVVTLGLSMMAFPDLRNQKFDPQSSFATLFLFFTVDFFVFLWLLWDSSTAFPGFLYMKTCKAQDLPLRKLHSAKWK